MKDIYSNNKLNNTDLCKGDRICSFCGAIIPDGKGVGTGSHKDGLFCNLDCYVQGICNSNNGNRTSLSIIIGDSSSAN